MQGAALVGAHKGWLVSFVSYLPANLFFLLISEKFENAVNC